MATDSNNNTRKIKRKRPDEEPNDDNTANVLKKINISFLGTKHKYGDEIVEAMLAFARQTGFLFSTYIEPFVGALGTMRFFPTEVDGRPVHRIANDLHPDLVAMWRALLFDEWTPQSVTKQSYLSFQEQYARMLKDQRSDIIDLHKWIAKDAPQRALVGFMLSFNAQYFASMPREEHLDRANKVARMLPALRDALPRDDLIFYNMDYTKFEPHGCLIYSDPPYVRPGNALGGTTNPYRGTPYLDSAAFWAKMRQWSVGNLVFVSEYQAPDDFVCIWSKDILSRGSGREGYPRKTRTERLFVHRTWYERRFDMGV